MNIEGEAENIGRGVSYCAVCDGAFFKDQEVVVIGGGNSALEEANYLTQFASKVHVVIRRDVFRADQIIQDSVLKNEKIHVIRKHRPVRILDDGQRVSGIVLSDVETKEEMTIMCRGIFPVI